MSSGSSNNNNNKAKATGTTFQLHASSAQLESFGDDVASLWCSSIIGRLQQTPESSFTLEFQRDYVSRSRPCIIEKAIQNSIGGDLTLSLNELVERASSQLSITVNVTPDGHGDVVRTVHGADGRTRRMFVKPQEKAMTLSEFTKQLREAGRDEIKTPDFTSPFDTDGRAILSLAEATAGPNVLLSCATNINDVLYYSRQNDCLRTEFKSLFDSNLVPSTFTWAEDAFGTGPPDAINVWIGDERAVSSMHKDHYENLFYVLEGEKVFTLCPPGDVPFLYEGEFESGTFHRDLGNGNWKVVPDVDGFEECGVNNVVKWIEADVEPLLEQSTRTKQINRFPLLERVHPIKITVRAGEMLYLPSLWFHRVTQTCETLGINYWYDMKFDSPLWCYFNFLQQLTLVVEHDDETKALREQSGNKQQD